MKREDTTLDDDEGNRLEKTAWLTDGRGLASACNFEVRTSTRGSPTSSAFLSTILRHSMTCLHHPSRLISTPCAVVHPLHTIFNIYLYPCSHDNSHLQSQPTLLLGIGFKGFLIKFLFTLGSCPCKFNTDLT